jgi:hypothetical protein
MTTQYTFDDKLFSDLHKDAYGFRPDRWQFDLWNGMTDDQKQAKWDSMIDVMREEERLREESEQIAVKAFENEVTRKVAKTGKTRVEVIQEMVIAENPTYRDPSYLCYQRGLPIFYLLHQYGME